MRLLRRRIRNLFILQAVLLFAAAIVSVAVPRYAAYTVSPFRHYGVILGCAACGLVFAKAWWSTRNVSPHRDLWAATASFQWAAVGVPFVWFEHASLAHAAPGLFVTALGATGTLFFSRNRPLPTTQSGGFSNASAERRERISVPGDRTSTWTNHAFAALSVVAEFTVLFLWAHWARGRGLAAKESLPWYVVFVIAVLASTLLHESGHALLAWFLKMKLHSFNAGPFQWRKLDGRWKFKFDAEGFYNLGTAVRVAPADSEQPLIRDLCVIAAGPLASVFWGAVALWAVLHVEWPFYQETWRLVAFTASFCFIAAFTNLLPFMTEDGGYSDGARILQWMTNSPLNNSHRATIIRPSVLVAPLLQAPEM